MNSDSTKPQKKLGGVKSADGLTEAKRRFVAEFVKDGNATQAAIRAGYSEATAGQQGSRLLKDVRIKQAIEHAQKAIISQIQAETGITLERTLREIARLAFFDPRKMFDKDGKPLQIQDLDDDTAAAIAGVDVLEEYIGSGKDRVFVGLTKKYKLTDKKASLDMLMKHLGGFKEDNEQGAKAAVDAAAAAKMTGDEAYKLMLKK